MKAKMVKLYFQYLLEHMVTLVLYKHHLKVKTFFVSLLSAIYLAEDLHQFCGDLKANRNDKHLIHFDTEQGNFHAQMVFKRPLEMAGLKNIDKYHTLALRQYSFNDRIEIIEHYLYDRLDGKNIGLVIIDGIADLCSDVNNIEESNNVVQKANEMD